MAVDLSTWTGTNCTVATVTEGTGVNAVSFLRVTRTGANPYITSPSGRSENGKIHRMFRAKVRKHGGVAVATSFTGRLSWTTAGHGFSGSYKNELSAPSGKAIDEWFDLTWDNTSPTAGGTDWSDNTITQLRLELSNGSGDVWDILVAGVGNTGATPWTDTPQIIPYATLKPSFDYAVGPFLLPKKNLTPPSNWVKLHSVTLTMSGYGEALINWVGTVDFGHNNYGYFSLLIDLSPAFDGAGVINNFNRQLKIKADSSSNQLSQTFTHMATGLSAGAHTFDLYGQQDNETSQHSIRDSSLTILEMKT